MDQLPPGPSAAGPAEDKARTADPHVVLRIALQRAERSLDQPIVADAETQKRINGIARGLGNRAVVRVLMACSLAKICHPHVDIRKPYTEIGAPDSFSGRTYDSLFVDKIVTTYEMKDKEITIEDIHLALAKLQNSEARPDNYLFVTTAAIDKRVVEYARGIYRTIGVEFAVIDCIAFLRHFLHLFHRSRLDFLEAYQALVLAEPTSGVSQPLKEAFLTLRRAAEYNNNTD